MPVAFAGGKPMWFLLDTGSQHSFLTRRASTMLVEAGSVVEEDGMIAVPDVRLGSYSVGKIRFADEGAGFAQSVDGYADGYLGMDVLRRYRVGIDIREKTLRLWPTDVAVRDWFTAPAESLVTVPLVERPSGWCVPVEVGNLTVPMVLDTGSGDTFVHSDVASLLKEARKAKRNVRTLPFYDGLHRVRMYTVPAVGLGGVSLGERVVGVANVPRMVGLLGRDLISPLKVLLDYPAGRATFAGLEGQPAPLYEGPAVTMSNGVIVRWPRGAVANAPPGCAYTLPAGYREIFRADESIDLVPERTAPR